MMFKMKGILAVMLGAMCMATGTAQAGAILDTPILGGNFLVAADGSVFATYDGSRAGYSSTLFYGDREIFNNSRSTRRGARENLGVFSAGDQLDFRLWVENLGTSFVSGSGAANPDGLAHFRAITTATVAGFKTSVGVEDQLGGGDLDFNDFLFSLSNVIDPPANAPPSNEPVDVAEPPALFLIAVGILGLLARRRSGG